MTSIYLMKDDPTGLYKIGHSYDPKQREKTLLAQAPKITLICYWENQTEFVEKFLHKRYKDQRRRGEWFELEERHLWDLYFIPGLNKHGRVDVVTPNPAFLSKVMIKSCVWAIKVAQSQKDPNYPHAWMAEIARESSRIFPN